MNAHEIATKAIEEERRKHKNRSSARLAGAALEALRNAGFEMRQRMATCLATSPLFPGDRHFHHCTDWAGHSAGSHLCGCGTMWQLGKVGSGVSQ